MRNNSVRCCLCCKHLSLLTRKISNRDSKRRNIKNPSTTCQSAADTMGLRSSGPAEHVARKEHRRWSQAQAVSKFLVVPVCRVCTQGYTATASSQPGKQGDCHHDSKQTLKLWTHSLRLWVSPWDRLRCSRNTQLVGGGSTSSSILCNEWTSCTLHKNPTEFGLSLRLRFSPELELSMKAREEVQLESFWKEKISNKLYRCSKKKVLPQCLVMQPARWLQWGSHPAVGAGSAHHKSLNIRG